MAAYLGKADAIIAVSNSVARDLTQEFGIDRGRVSEIYNPTNVQTIGVLRHEPTRDS